MNELEMLNYLKNNLLYEDSYSFCHEEKLIHSDKYISVSDLVVHFIETDKSYKRQTWNLRQILDNIDMIAPQ